MTPDEERDLLDGVAEDIEQQAKAAMATLVGLIRDGVAPRDAVAQAMEPLTAAAAATVRDALTAIVGEAAAVAIEAGTIQLSRRLYVEAQTMSVTVQGIVQRHAEGFQDARALARELFEGYGFREPDAEPLQISPRNPKLPKYLREAVADVGVAESLARPFARVQVDGLSTLALRAAYSELLDAIDRAEAGAGRAALEKRLEVAFQERARYFAQRIAQTELHRAYAMREAHLLMTDEAVVYVQIRRAPGRGAPCICALMTGRDAYGLGPGVYPKARAPVPPFHPFCRCRTVARLDLSQQQAKPEDEGADAYFLRRVGEPIAARVMGSQAKRDAVLAGQSAETVANATRDPAYRIRPIGG